MFRTLLLIGTASSVLLGGCDFRTWTRAREQERQLQWIKVASAEADADQAVAQGDRRLYGVYGYSIEMYGAPESAAWVPNGCGLKMIEGTSDVIYSKDTYERPRVYARRYNERVISRTSCLRVK